MWRQKCGRCPTAVWTGLYPPPTPPPPYICALASMKSGSAVIRHTTRFLFISSSHTVISGGSKGVRRGRAPPPLGAEFSLISCSFWEILIKSYLGAPPERWRPLLGEILDPPLVITNMRQLKLSTNSTTLRLMNFHIEVNLNAWVECVFYRWVYIPK